MSLVPIDVIAAISMLNSHARAYGCGKKAIYAYKGLVAIIYAHVRRAQAKPVGLMSKCTYCDGTGKFVSIYDGPTNERCRNCGASSYVHLRFCETTIEGHRWHHPWYGRGYPTGQTMLWYDLGKPDIEYDQAARALKIKHKDRPVQEITFGSVGEWKPMLPGEKLDGDNLAGLLNVVEDWLFSAHADSDLRFTLDRAREESGQYGLDVGRIGERCHYCGGEPVSGQMHQPGKLAWHVRTCEQHRIMAVDQWDKSVPPAALTPAVMKWLERRAKLTERGAA